MIMEKAIQEEANYQKQLESALAAEQATEEKVTNGLHSAKSQLQDLDVANKAGTIRLVGNIEPIHADATLEEIQEWFAPLGVNATSIVENSKKGYDIACKVWL